MLVLRRSNRLRVCATNEPSHETFRRDRLRSGPGSEPLPANAIASKAPRFHRGDSRLSPACVRPPFCHEAAAHLTVSSRGP